MEMNYQEIWNDNPLQLVRVPVEDIIVRHEISGRSGYKRDPKMIKGLAASIASQGQIHPATVGINVSEALGPVGAPILYDGFGRLEAVKGSGTPLLCRYDPAIIEIIPADVNEETGELLGEGGVNSTKQIVRGLHENIHREDLSPVQLADSIAQLNASGMKDAEIARQLNMSAATISLHKRLNALDEEGLPLFSKFAKEKIHLGHIPSFASFQLADLGSAEEIDKEITELISAAEKVGQKVTAKAVTEVVRKKGKKKTKSGKIITKGRSAKEVIVFLESLAERGGPAVLKVISKQAVAYARGEKEAEAAKEAIVKAAA